MLAPAVASPLLALARNALNITFYQKRKIANFLSPFQSNSHPDDENLSTAKQGCNALMITEKGCTEAELLNAISQSKRHYLRLLGIEGVIIFQAITFAPERGVSGPFPTPSLAQVLQMQWTHVTVDSMKETATVSCRNEQGPPSTFYFHPTSRQSVLTHLREAKQSFEEELGIMGIRIFLRTPN